MGASALPLFNAAAIRDAADGTGSELCAVAARLTSEEGAREDLATPAENIDALISAEPKKGLIEEDRPPPDPVRRGVRGKVSA